MNRFFNTWSSSRWRMFQSHLHRARQLHNTHPRLNTTPSSQATTSSATTTSRFDRFIARTPTRFLRTRLSALKNAPVSTITSFLILHEITAVVPLFALAAYFHYTKWLPPFFAEGEWVLKGVELFGRYFRRKGWITAEDAQNAKDAAEEGEASAIEKRGRISHDGQDTAVVGADCKTSNRTEMASKWWNRGEGGTRLVIEFATAYAVVKALLPFRIMISIWGAPWFARWTTIPLANSFSKRASRSRQLLKTVADQSKNR